MDTSHAKTISKLESELGFSVANNVLTMLDGTRPVQQPVHRAVQVLWNEMVKTHHLYTECNDKLRHYGERKYDKSYHNEPECPICVFRDKRLIRRCGLHTQISVLTTWVGAFASGLKWMERNFRACLAGKKVSTLEACFVNSSILLSREWWFVAQDSDVVPRQLYVRAVEELEYARHRVQLLEKHRTA